MTGTEHGRRIARAAAGAGLLCVLAGAVLVVASAARPVVLGGVVVLTIGIVLIALAERGLASVAAASRTLHAVGSDGASYAWSVGWHGPATGGGWWRESAEDGDAGDRHGDGHPR